MARLEHSADGEGRQRGNRSADGRARRWLAGALIGLVVGIPCSVVSADVLTVGDHGTYLSIQAAISAAVGSGSHTIRVEQGTYVENFWIGTALGSDSLEITGGWNATFSARSSDASLTVIDGGSADRVVAIITSGGSVLIDGFTITNGYSNSGAGIRVATSGDAVVTVSNNRIIGNTVNHHSVPGGGGFYYLQFSGNGHCSLVDNLISGNTLVNTGGLSANGGGVYFDVDDASSFTATGNRITDNTCSAPAKTIFGCGAYVLHNSTATSVFDDNVIKGNRTETAAGDDVEGAGGQIGMGPNGNALSVRRNLWIDNRDVGSQEGYHVKFFTHGNGSLITTDSVVAGGPDIGVGAWSYETSTLRLTNLTVFDHADTGVSFRGSGAESSLYNTIVFASPTLTDFDGTSVLTGGNLLGIDPLFVEPANWECRLRSGSPALDTGDNAAPGGLGPTDADGNPRVLDGVVDVGAYEGVATLFEDGFETGDTSFWSLVAP